MCLKAYDCFIIYNMERNIHTERDKDTGTQQNKPKKKQTYKQNIRQGN